MLKKIGLGLTLTAAFGLMSCEDSSSTSSSGGEVTISCKVVSEDPFTIKSSEAGISGNITYELIDGKVVETYKFDNSALAEDECEDMKSHKGYTKVKCDGKKIVAYTDDEQTEAQFKRYTKQLKDYCESMDGRKVDASDFRDDDSPKSSSSIAKSSSSAKSSTTISSCDFNLNDNVWEFSYSADIGAAGMSTKETIRYEFKGKNVTKTITTTSTGSLIPSVCESYKADDYEEEDEYGSFKVETTCNGNDMIVKSIDVTFDYEKNYATKEEILHGAKAQCSVYN